MDKKYYLVIVLMILEIVSLTLMYKSVQNKNVVLDEVKLINDTNNNMFSIMTDETGNGTYTEYTKSNTWPGVDSYKFNSGKTQCMNENGDKVVNTISYENGNIKLNAYEGAHCILYFDKCLGPKNTILSGKTDISVCEVGGMYRYQGTDNINNYICYGKAKNCSTNSTDIDKYMYRIIGVTPDGQLALIKETGVKEGSTVNFYWNNKYRTSECGSDSSKCTWPLSRIYNRLNGLCTSSNTNCSGKEAGVNGQTNIFIGNSYYEYLNNNSTWLSKIIDHSWKYGDTTSNGNYYGDTIYEIESKFPNSVEAKIGLQYIHDYYYAYPGGNPGNYSTAKDAWIYLSKDGNSGISYEWLISRYGVSGTTVRAWRVLSTGIVNNLLDIGNGARPVFYLSNKVTFKSGTGSKTDPYIINGIDAAPYIKYYKLYSDPTSSEIVSTVNAVDDDQITKYCFSYKKTTESSYSTETCVENSDEIYGTNYRGLSPSTLYDLRVRVFDNANNVATATFQARTKDSANKPTCWFTVSYDGVTLVTQNATSWLITTTPPSGQWSYGTGSKTISDLKESKYYGFVKDDSGQTGTCTLDMTLATMIKCTATKNTSSGNCTVEETVPGAQICYYQTISCGEYINPSGLHCTGTAGRVLATNEVGSCLPSMNKGCDQGASCVRFTCGCQTQTAYKCSDGASYNTQYDCTSKDCTKTTYDCSDGHNYPTESECTSRPCDFSCSSGYLKFSREYGTGYCYKQIG